MTDKISEELEQTLSDKIPSGDLGSGEDVSNCVAFLARVDMANYVNGETIHVNGGTVVWLDNLVLIFNKIEHFNEGFHVRR